MENPDQDMELRQSSSQASRVTLNTGDYSEPQQEHEPEPESNQETPEPTRPPRLELLEFRTEQLHNRRFLLLRMEHMRKKAVTFEDSDETCELESIESELEELQAEKKALEEQGESSTLTENGGQQDDCPTYYKSGTVIQPCGGIYILPPPRLTQEDIAVVQTVKTTAEAETPTGPITPDVRRVAV
ncbi:putative lipopolysaccharide-induced tumor necrosis factor-alpha factor -like [Scophthalmus maximus]|uniref:Putative lipopolysaccharide-induced tumor necrosis factor-alpha factor-like n=1 Tax=Scophthalmus maximus TaxID=52904 RepID=A0A2U9CLB1_SCOMX|nr:putative lipopolysaccharide-induced tumor necrosis factor-alpha factor -like [Scophthalmus maximus]